MRDVIYLRPRSADEALAMHAAHAGARYFAGGTTLYDLMKLGVEAPAALVDVSAIGDLAKLDASDPSELRIGAMMSMSELAEDPVLRAEFPALAESLWKAASQQLRNMATVGGNLLQRTRCAYFRGGAEYACNKRKTGSGCAAIDGLNRGHALFGGSADCVAVYPGDWAVALAAFDAVVDVASARGICSGTGSTGSTGSTRTIPLRELHREPGDTPQRETNIGADELIVRIRVPRVAAGKASVYHQISSALDSNSSNVQTQVWHRKAPTFLKAFFIRSIWVCSTLACSRSVGRCAMLSLTPCNTASGVLRLWARSSRESR